MDTETWKQIIYIIKVRGKIDCFITDNLIKDRHTEQALNRHKTRHTNRHATGTRKILKN